MGITMETLIILLGTSLSVTALHKDNYENIYVQVLGQKHFVLLPPIEAPCINEQNLQPTTYACIDLERPGEQASYQIRPDEQDSPDVPFATWDPDLPQNRQTRYSHLSEPMRITLNPGDMMYLPALWYHKVSQSNSSEGLSCSVNYWYDLDPTPLPRQYHCQLHTLGSIWISMARSIR
jgi:peptidyl-lysine (3S)-dioxygenase / protease